METVLIVAENLEAERLYEEAHGRGIRGWLLDPHTNPRLLVSNQARELYELSLAMGQQLIPVTLDQGEFPSFPLIEVMHTRAPPRQRVSLDSADRNGGLKGWATCRDFGYVTVSISVDGERVGEAFASQFRRDLLKAGVGHGAHGFRFRPPDKFLDGRVHKIWVSVVETGEWAERELVLPFHFNHARPWLGGAPALVDWTEADERRLHAARACMISSGEAKELRSLIEDKPSSIFRDLGLEERHARLGRDFPTFRERLNSRWVSYYDGRACERTPCCKEARLSYNSPFSKTQNEWNPQDLLDACPRPMRHFASKRMMKRFMARMPVKVPETYGVLRSAEEFDRFDLPERFVMKPESDSGRALYIMHGDLNLENGYRYTQSDLRSEIENYLTDRPDGAFIIEELLVQEGTDPEQEFVPLDYKMHAFGGRVRLIHVDDRNCVSRDPLHRSQSWFSRDWVAAPFRMRQSEQENDYLSRPDCFDEMLQIADAVAVVLGGYIRIDLYATDVGPVFGELTTYSHSGRGFTEYGSTILSQAWELFPDMPRARDLSGSH